MHGEYGKSIPQKVVLTINHLLSVMLMAWLLFYNGIDVVFSWFNAETGGGNSVRNQLLTGLAFIYFLRILVTYFYLIKRKMNWDEVIMVAAWVYFFHIYFAIKGGVQSEELGWVEWLGIGLFVIGSWINTSSERARHRWKQNPDHKGKLFTGHLFRYAQHINYFGDSVLYTGFAFVTGTMEALFLPAIMTALFIFMHIPMKEKYLTERYGTDFQIYASNTKKLFPFIY